MMAPLLREESDEVEVGSVVGSAGSSGSSAELAAMQSTSVTQHCRPTPFLGTFSPHFDATMPGSLKLNVVRHT